MLPWGHAALGYVCYSLGRRSLTGDAPNGLKTGALLVGAQLPDLVDKPLSWTFGLLPTGRSLGHSVFVAALIVALAVAVTRRFGRAGVGVAFGVGHVSHLVGDSLGPLAGGRVEDLSFLLWPAIRASRIEHGWSFAEFFLTLSLTPPILLELALTASAVGLWMVDGTPGVGEIEARVGQRGTER